MKLSILKREKENEKRSKYQKEFQLLLFIPSKKKINTDSIN